MDNLSSSNKFLTWAAFGVAFVVLATGIYLLLTALETDETTDDIPEVAAVNTNAAPLPPPTEGINRIAPPQALTDFTFPANNGDPLSLSDLRGQYVLLTFGYTHCPDVCPANLLEFRQIKRNLGEDANNVTFMFISVDPDRDTPEFLDRYIQRYDPEFIGLSGEHTELEQIADEYGLFWDFRENTGSQAGYLVDHTASRFLISPDGELIRIYSFTTSPQAIESDLRDLF
jgi:protein SCO1